MRRYAAGGTGPSTWHARALRRSGHLSYVNQFDIEDEIGFCGNPGMLGSVVGDDADSVSELPGNEDAALATDLHAGKALVEAGNKASHALGK